MKESFEWLNLEKVDELPKDRLLKVVAKTPTTTVHPEDPNYPVRIFAETQLMRNAASLVGRPVGLDHAKLPIYGAYAIDSEWNEEEKQLEALLLVPPEYVKKVHDGAISKSSIEYTWRDIEDKPEGKEFIGLSINRIDLLETLKPGDANATVTLFEAKKQLGSVLAEVTLGESFAGYRDMEDCIAQNQDKEDPAAYCATIMRATETSTPVEKAEELVKEVKTLTEALQRVTKELTETKASINDKISLGTKVARDKLISSIEAVIPKNFILRQNTAALNRLTQDVKKVLKEFKGE